MLVFPDARHAVPAILAIEQRCAAEEHFPAIRGGINAGPVLFQAGEYLGATVNLAARLAAAAERHQVLVGADVRREAADAPGVAFRPVGARRLKGITEPVEVWDATSTTAGTRARLVDPVCGMELSPEEVSVRLSSDAGEVAFCSQACLRRYVARNQ